jgi:hypothetical protein
MNKFSSSKGSPFPSKLLSRPWQKLLSLSMSVWCLGAVAILPVVAQTPPARGFVINGSNEGDFSGGSVSDAGDVNGDGIPDEIVGANGANTSSTNEPGRSNVVFGKRNNQPVELSAIESGASLDGFVINGRNGLDYSGFSVSAAGDVNGDGLADVIVGVPGADPNNKFTAGRSYIVFGKRNVKPVQL